MTHEVHMRRISHFSPKHCSVRKGRNAGFAGARICSVVSFEKVVLFGSMLLLMLGTPKTLLADLPLGGKTASMGGAGTAAGKDAAMPFINPAGYSQVPHHTLSLSASLYRMEAITVNDYFFHGSLDPQLGDLAGTPSVNHNDLTSRKFSSFPGVASALWHFGDAENDSAVHHVLALSMVVQSNINREFSGDFSLRFGPTASLTLRDSLTKTFETVEYLFGPTYAINFGTFRIGTSIFLAYTDAVRTTDSSTTSSDPVQYLKLDTGEYFEGNIFGLQPALGFQWEPTYGLAVGAAWVAPMIPLIGKFDYSFSAQSMGPPSTDANYVEEIRADGDVMLRRPMRLRLGLAIGYPKEWSVAVDGEVVFPMAEQFFQHSNVARSYQEQGFPVVLERYEEEYTTSSPAGFNVHGGAEWYFNEMLALRMGGYYVKSNTDLEMDSAHLLNLDLDHVGGSIGLGIESDIGETTFGFQFDYGFGNTVVGDVYARFGSISYATAATTSMSGVFFLSGSFDLEEFDAVIKAIRKPSLALGKERKNISIAMVSPTLAAFANDPVMQAIFADNRFSYAVTGYDEFDDLFERVAKMKAASEIATEMLAQMEAQVRTLQITLDPKTDLSMVLGTLIRYAQTHDKSAAVSTLLEKPEAARMVELFQMGQATAEVLQFFGSEATKLPADVQALIEKAQSDFVGPDMILLPAVARNLGAAEQDVVDIVKQIPRLVKAMGHFFAAFQQVEVSAAESSSSGKLQFRLKLDEMDESLLPFANHETVLAVLDSDDALYSVAGQEWIDTAQKEWTKLNVLLAVGEGAMQSFMQIQERLKLRLKSAKYRKAALFQLYQLATEGGTPSNLSALGNDAEIQAAIGVVGLLLTTQKALHNAFTTSETWRKPLGAIIDSPEELIEDAAQIPFILSIAQDTMDKTAVGLERAAALLVRMDKVIEEVQ